MGSVFAGKMILEAILHSLKIMREVGGDAAPHLQTASIMSLKQPLICK